MRGHDIPRPRTNMPALSRRGHGGVSARHERAVAPPPVAQQVHSPPLPAPPQTDRPGRNRRPALVALLVGLVVLLAGAAWAIAAPRFQVRTIRVEGTSNPQLLAAIRTLPLGGCDVFRCDLASRERQVEALVPVAHAEVRTVPPDTVVVRVTPRTPALLWRDPRQDVVISEDGVVLGALEANPAYARLNLPAIPDPGSALFGTSLPGPGQRIDPALVEMARQLRRGTTEALGAGWSLRYTGDQGFVATRDGGPLVIYGYPADAAYAANDDPAPAALGRAPDVATVSRGAQVQIAELRALLAALARSKQAATLIDLRWGTHPFYRTG